MPVKVRLSPAGKRKQVHYDIVVADSRSPRNGKYVEIIGSYHPYAGDEAKEAKTAEESGLKIDRERLAYWVKNGAQLSETVEGLIRRANRMAPAAAAPKA